MVQKRGQGGEGEGDGPLPLFSGELDVDAARLDSLRGAAAATDDGGTMPKLLLAACACSVSLDRVSQGRHCSPGRQQLQ